MDWILENIWMAQVAGIFIVTLLATWTLRRVFKRLYPKLQQSRMIWDDTLFYALRQPIMALIWTVAAVFAIQLTGIQTIIDGALTARHFAIIGTVIWFLWRFITQAQKRILETKDTDQTTVHAVGQILRVSVVIVGSLFILPALGINISGLLAFGGISGIAVGFAAKDLLGNFFGGLMIYFDRPFKVGDWVRSPDKEIEGFVEHIGFRLTRIRTFTKRPLYVPNGIFSNISVENVSRMTNRRIKTHFGVRYDDASKVSTISEEVRAMIQNHPAIDTKHIIIVNFEQFGPSSLDMLIYCFTKETRWVPFCQIQEEIFLKVIQIVESHGAQCAFPTTTLHMPEGVDLRTANINLSARAPRMS